MRYDQYSELPYSDELYHHGIKGQKWGVRRYQNSDGSLTAEGRKRYGADGEKANAKLHAFLSKTKSEVKRSASKIGETGKKVASKMGKVSKNLAVKAGRGIVKGFKRRHPRFMSDSELKAEKARLDMEISYKDAVNNLNSRKFSRQFMAATGEIAKNGAKRFAETAGNKAAEKWVNNLFSKESDNYAEKEKRLINLNNYRNRLDETANMNDSTNLVRNKNEQERTVQNIRNARNSRERDSYNRQLHRLQAEQTEYENRIRERTQSLNARRNMMNKQGYTVYERNKDNNGGSTNRTFKTTRRPRHKT